MFPSTFLVRLVALVISYVHQKTAEKETLLRNKKRTQYEPGLYVAQRTVTRLLAHLRALQSPYRSRAETLLAERLAKPVDRRR